MSTRLRCATLRAAYATISPAQGLIRLWYCHRPHPHLSRTARTPTPAARFPHSPPASPFLRRMPPLSPVPRSHTHPRPPIPPRPLIRPRPLLRRRFHFKHRRALAWTRQDRLGRIEPRGCSGYSPWSRNHFNICETQDRHTGSCSVDRSPSKTQRPFTVNLLMRRGQSGK